MPRDAHISEEERQTKMALVARDIQEHLSSRKVKKDQAKELANEGLRLEEHVELSAQIQYSRMAVERLLDRLGEETTVDEVVAEPGVSDVGQSGRIFQRGEDPLDDDYVGEVLLLREGAAAECTNETMSVADYAAEPPSPPVDPDEDGYEWNQLAADGGGGTSSGMGSLLTVRMPSKEEGGCDLSEVICQEIRVSTRKIHHSMFMAKQLMLMSPQWWGSRMIARRINTFVLRANYHARKVKTWSDKLRSRAFLNSTAVNKSAQDVASDMAFVSRNHLQLAKKLEDAVAEKKSLERQLADVRQRMKRLNGEREDTQRRLMTIAHCKDPSVAETVLLLKHLQPIDRLQGRCQAIRQWLVVKDTFQGK